MTWIKFIYWVLGLYTFYYLANIAWDLLRGQRQSKTDATPELHFDDSPAPQKVMAEQPKEKPSETVKSLQKEPVISAMGGVNLKDLFNLAKAEVIAYNRAVSF